MKFGTGQSWESQSTPQMKMQAAKDFANPPPAITRKAKRSLHDIEYLIDHAMDQADLQIEIIRDALAEAYVSQVWRESDATSFADWIFRKWGKSKSWGYRMIQEYVKQTFPEVENCVSTKTDTQPVTNETEEDEKPTVRAATPEQMKRVEPQGPHSEIGPTGKPSENGKPKSQLAIWTQVHDSYGALLRDVDRLHNLAPKESLHNELLTLTKRAMECIRKWQSEV